MRDYNINFLSGAFTPGVPGKISYSINDKAGTTLARSDFTEVHEKLMHTIVVNKDLSNFQHVHPEINGDGVFELDNFTFPDEGTYRLFADFSPAATSHGDHHHTSVVLHHDIQVGEKVSGEPRIEPRTADYAQGYEINMRLNGDGHDKTMAFVITRDGQPITDLDNYLGALGHLVVLSKEGLEYLHAHPHGNSNDKQASSMDFMVHFTSAGRYKAFLQFQHRNEIITASFGLSV